MPCVLLLLHGWTLFPAVAAPQTRNNGTSSGHLSSLRASAPRELSLHLASSTARWPCTALCHRAHGPHQPRAGTTRPYQVARLHPQARPQGSTPPSVAPHRPPPRPRVITFEPSSSQQTSPPSASPLDCRGLPPASPLPAPSTRPSQRLSPEQDPRTALPPLRRDRPGCAPTTFHHHRPKWLSRSAS